MVRVKAKTIDKVVKVFDKDFFNQFGIGDDNAREKAIVVAVEWAELARPFQVNLRSIVLNKV